MYTAFRPATVLLEFATWFGWWMIFRALQGRVCRQYPGLRTVNRMIFLWTLAVAVAPGAWTLIFHTARGPLLVVLFNHAFGAGVFAQTALRSLLMVPWLSGPGGQLAGRLPLPLGAERYIMATMLALTQVMVRPDIGPVRERKSEAG